MKEDSIMDKQALPVEVDQALSRGMIRCADINPQSVKVVTVTRIINAVDEGSQHYGHVGFASGSRSSPQ